MEEKAAHLEEVKNKAAEGRKMEWKDAKKEVVPVVSQNWTIVEEEEPEEDWVVVKR